MAKRQRVDTIAGEKTSFQGAAKAIDPPEWVLVPEPAMKFWYSITKARAAERWNDADLENAAELARTKARIEKLNIEIESEGDVIKNDRGTPIVNPKHNLLETLTRRMVALSRMLQVHAEATQGKSRDQVKPNKAKDKAQTTVQSVSDDDLIAKPMH